jgi:HK97 family phage major capsid protein
MSKDDSSTRRFRAANWHPDSPRRYEVPAASDLHPVDPKAKKSNSLAFARCALCPAAHASLEVRMTKNFRKALMEQPTARAIAATGLRMLVGAIPALALVLMAFGIYTLISGHSVGGGGTVLVAGTIPLGIQRKEAPPAATLSELEAVVTRHLNGMKAEVKSFADGVDPKILELKERVNNLEQRSVTRTDGDGGAGESVGRLVLSSPQFVDFLAAGRRSSGKIAIGSSMTKTAIVSPTGLNQPLVAPYIRPGVVTPAMQRLTIRDLFPQIPVSTNMVEYFEETSFTNNAAIQGLATSPQVYENVAKAESAMAFALKYQPVMTIAHWIPVSKQMLSDASGLEQYLNVRLLYGLKLAEETELLNGTGVGASLKGLITAATAYDAGSNVSGDTKIDTIRHAIRQNEARFYPVDFIVLNPADNEAIDLIKTTGTASSGEYISADPRMYSQKLLWGRPVVQTPSIAAGHFLVGSAMAATIWDRANATVEISYEHADFFIKNMAAVLCEERLALTVEIPRAITYGAF